MVCFVFHVDIKMSYIICFRSINRKYVNSCFSKQNITAKKNKVSKVLKHLTQKKITKWNEKNVDAGVRIIMAKA